MIVTVRASSWGSLFDCAHRWEAEHILGMRKPGSLRAWLGTAIHHGTAVFDQAKLDNKTITPDDACGAFVGALHHPADEVDYQGDKTITLNSAEVIGLALTAKYCADIAPRMTYQSVEMQLNPLDIDCDDGLTIRLTGTMDRARTAQEQNGVVIADVKSGSRIIANGAVQLKGKHAQIGVYALMYEHTTGESTAGGQIIGLQTTAKADVAMSPVFDAKRHLIGNPGEKGLIEYAAIMFKTGFFPPNPQSGLCSSKFCARWDSCAFHE